MKEIRGSGGTAPCNLHLSNKCSEWSASNPTPSLYYAEDGRWSSSETSISHINLKRVISGKPKSSSATLWGPQISFSRHISRFLCCILYLCCSSLSLSLSLYIYIYIILC
jgi:hypothetical protein